MVSGRPESGLQTSCQSQKSTYVTSLRTSFFFSLSLFSFSSNIIVTFNQLSSREEEEDEEDEEDEDKEIEEDEEDKEEPQTTISSRTARKRNA